jgi:hypothetical protein
MTALAHLICLRLFVFSNQLYQKPSHSEAYLTTPEDPHTLLLNIAKYSEFISGAFFRRSYSLE